MDFYLLENSKTRSRRNPDNPATPNILSGAYFVPKPTQSRTALGGLVDRRDTYSTSCGFIFSRMYPIMWIGGEAGEGHLPEENVGWVFLSFPTYMEPEGVHVGA